MVFHSQPRVSEIAEDRVVSGAVCEGCDNGEIKQRNAIKFHSLLKHLI